MNRKSTIIALAVLLVAGASAWMAYNRGSDPQDRPTASASGGEASTNGALVQVTLPATLSEQAQVGKMAFEAKCAVCHGANAAGVSGKGPPLIHKIYEPSHHSDTSFLLAAKNGVRAHHWKFGNMPAIDGLTDGDVMNIVRYVREVQRENGIN